ncbi:PfkB family carbohydrate kinase [Lysinibacillus pakistanensis]|uniref:PfkB family carbohydrate kinase n=1 Tax=Lysinibacillus pakistanensis TaxID=759811 RepID=UPI0034E3BD7F
MVQVQFKIRTQLRQGEIDTVPHFVKEGETLSSVSYDEFPGGKGLNQSIALAKSGAQVFHAGKIGKDGQFLKQQLALEGINVEGIYDNGLIRACHYSSYSDR